MKKGNVNFEALVIGTSAGGFDALANVIPSLNRDFPMPVLIVIHRNSQSDSFLSTFLNDKSALNVKEAVDKEEIVGGNVYIAPPNYHMFVGRNHTINLSTTPAVNFSRPAIDPLFETASEVYFEKLIGLVLTGGNDDGSRGLLRIKKMGGHTIVQTPEDAKISVMPESAVKAVGAPDMVLNLNEIPGYLNSLAGE